MSDSGRRDPPSPFILEWIERLATQQSAGSRALDVAAGGGRHSEVLLRAGYRVFAIDRRLEALATLRKRLAEHQGAVGNRLLVWAGDLTGVPLPKEFFALVVVTRYLQRDLFPALKESLVPDGVLLYETFTEAQRAHGTGPRSPDHLLRTGELRAEFSELEILFYEEVASPEAVARLVVRRRFSDSKASSGSDTAPSRADP